VRVASRVIVPAFALIWFAAPASAALVELEEIEQCVRANKPELSSVQTVVFKAVDRAGSVNESRAKISWKKFPDGFSRVVIRFSEPPTRRGSALLAIELESSVDTFLYLPEVRKVRRVAKSSLSGSLFGTDFTYEDFERLQGLTEDATRELLPDSVLDDRPVYIIQGLPARGEDSEYERLVSYVDQEMCLPIRVELFGKNDRIVKVVTVPPAKVTKESSGHVPRLIRMDDLLDETHTELTIEKIAIDEDIPDRIFSVKNLQTKRR
jgi:hypothetical protein